VPDRCSNHPRRGNREEEKRDRIKEQLVRTMCAAEEEPLPDLVRSVIPNREVRSITSDDKQPANACPRG